MPIQGTFIKYFLSFIRFFCELKDNMGIATRTKSAGDGKPLPLGRIFLEFFYLRCIFRALFRSILCYLVCVGWGVVEGVTPCPG